MIVQTKVAEQLVAAARVALPTDQAAVARQVLADDLQLLTSLDRQIDAVTQRLGVLVTATPLAVLSSVPGWATLRVAAYAAAVGEPARWPSARQLYRAAGLTPTLYESTGRRRDGAISREGSVPLRRALWDLGVGLWHCDPPASAYASRLRARGKPGGVIACALANRAGRIALPWSATKPPTTPTGGGEPAASQSWPRVPSSSVGRPDQTPSPLWRTPGLRRA